MHVDIETLLTMGLGLLIALAALWVIHKIVGHPDIGSGNKAIIWMEVVMFVLVVCGYVMGEMQRVSRNEQLEIHIGDVLLLVGLLVVSAGIIKLFARGD